MTPHIRRTFSALCAVLFGTVSPEGAAAQFGTTIDLHAGPLAWQPTGTRDPLISSQIEARYQIPSWLGLRPELRGGFDLGTAGDGGAVQWDLGVRLHSMGVRTGAWLGATFGAAGAGSFEHAMNKLEGGIRQVMGPARVNVWVARTGFGVGRGLNDGLGQDSTGGPDTLARRGLNEYTDVGSRVTLDLSRYELGLSLVRRIGSVDRGTGWELSGTWWMMPSVGLLGVTGHSLPQLGLALPGGRYGTLGLRLSLGARSPTERAPAPGIDATTKRRPALVVDHGRLSITGSPARRAEVMGDFTDWIAEPLVSLGVGQWTLPATLAPGVHYMNVRFDGGEWVVPPGIPAVDDGFGGRVGLVVAR